MSHPYCIRVVLPWFHFWTNRTRIGVEDRESGFGARRRRDWSFLFLPRRATISASWSWRLNDAACGPYWTKTFLADLHNIVKKRCPHDDHKCFVRRARRFWSIPRGDAVWETPFLRMFRFAAQCCELTFRRTGVAKELLRAKMPAETLERSVLIKKNRLCKYA